MKLSEFAELCAEIADEIEAEKYPELENSDDEPDSDIVLEFMEIFEGR